jgi:ATP-dependent Lon protease
MFICTANVLHTVPQALRDRMEVLQLAGYTECEEDRDCQAVPVAQGRSKARASRRTTSRFTDDAFKQIIQRYTREAGVRNLEREISSICRKIARKVVVKARRSQRRSTRPRSPKYLGVPRFRPSVAEEKNEIGIATGLAWTEVGGEILVTEATLMPGRGRLTLTGKLGDVMQESAQAAMSWLRSRVGGLRHPARLQPPHRRPRAHPGRRDSRRTAVGGHHAGDGDGLRAVARADTPRVAMTGEITLRGKVLPIGGVKEKLLAAHRAGLRNIIPAEGQREGPGGHPQERHGRHERASGGVDGRGATRVADRPLPHLPPPSPETAITIRDDALKPA